MAKRTIDELLDAIETVAILKTTVSKQDQVIARIVDRLEQLEQRIDAVAGHSRS